MKGLADIVSEPLDNLAPFYTQQAQRLKQAILLVLAMRLLSHRKQ